MREHNQGGSSTPTTFGEQSQDAGDKNKGDGKMKFLILTSW